MINNYELEFLEEKKIPGVGQRIDYWMTPSDSIDGIIVQTEAAALTAPISSTAQSGTNQVDILTFGAPGDYAPSEFFTLFDVNGELWSFGMDTTGADPFPSAQIWDDTLATRRGMIDISGAADDVAVAGLIRDAMLAIDGGILAGLITLVDPGDGTLQVTHDDRAPVAPPQSLLEDASGPGFTTITNTAVGASSTIDLATDSILFAGNPLWTAGKEVTIASTGVLPAGLAPGNYFAIPTATTGVYQLAASRADALVGTEVALVDEGESGAVISATPTATADCLIFNSLTKLTEAELFAAVTAEAIFDANTQAADSVYQGEVPLDLATYTTCRFHIAPNEAIGAFVLMPPYLHPHITLLILHPELRLTGTIITRRGIK